jgi:MFS family permease
VVSAAEPRQHYGAVLYGRAAGADPRSPLSGALLEMHGFMGHPGWFWMFIIEGLLAVGAGFFTFFWLDDTPQNARFLSAAEKQALISELASEEQKKVTSRLSDALRNGRVWQLAIIYLTIQVAVYGLIFSADPGCRAAGHQSRVRGLGGDRHPVGGGAVRDLADSALLRSHRRAA